jgi:hypothetical protein
MNGNGYDSGNRINARMFEEKVGYDSANKRMLIRVYDALKFVIEDAQFIDKSWANTIRTMFVLENNEAGLKNITINGYYSTIRKILKDINVIKYDGRTLVKGSNWGRFYSDEDWSWFKTSTQTGGYGEIVEPNGMPY